MRRLVPITLVLAALALPASALAANQGVTIGDGSYAPSTVRVHPGDTVTFTYNTPVPHGVAFSQDPGGVPNSCPPGVTLAPDCVIQFPNAGNFTFYDPATCTSTSGCPQTGEVFVDAPPTISSISGPATGFRGQPVEFTINASDPNGDAATYSFDFGDGQTTSSSGSSASHTFTTAGHFTVTGTVTDAQGNVSAPAQIGIDINVPDSDGDGVNDDQDQCVTVPGPGPSGCPLVPSPVPPRIAASVTAASALGAAGAIRDGVNAVLNCSGVCNAVFTLTKNGHAVALPVTAALSGAGSKLVTVRFTPAAKRTLARSKLSKLLLTVAVTDAVGRQQVRRAGIALERVKTYGKVPAVGVSDNQPTTFSDPNFQILKLRFARLVSPWNAIFTERARLDAWLQAARANHIRPLVSFEHSRGMNCPGRRCKAPSLRQYTRAWKAFHKKYPWVKDISPWNEANSATQPTGKRPDLAAAYYNVVRASCRGCTIVAADLLDATNIRRYAYAFLARAKGTPRLWGLHNYTDTNRFRARGTNALLQTVRGTVWLTETGGVVRFVTQSGKVALPKSESRAKKAMDYMFRLAELNASRIKRIYVYQWKINNPGDRFDAGVVRPNGTRRPSYQVLTVNASIARKR